MIKKNNSKLNKPVVKKLPKPEIKAPRVKGSIKVSDRYLDNSKIKNTNGDAVDKQRNKIRNVKVDLNRKKSKQLSDEVKFEAKLDQEEQVTETKAEGSDKVIKDTGIAKKQKKKNTISKEQKEKNRKKLRDSLFLALISLSAIFCILVVFMIRPPLHSDKVPSSVKTVYTFSNVNVKYTVNGNNVFLNGNDVYVNLSQFAEYIGLGSIGNKDTVKYYKEDGTYLIINNESSIISINGVELRLDAEIYIKGENVYVPADLFVYYTSGVDIIYNNNKSELHISSSIDEDRSNPNKTYYEEFGFTINPIEALPPIEESDLYI